MDPNRPTLGRHCLPVDVVTSRAGTRMAHAGSNGRRDRRLGRRAGLAAGAALAVTLAGFGVNAVAGITSGVTRATYHLDSSWGSGYQSTYTITNVGRSGVTAWRLEFDLPTSAHLTSVWGGSASASNGHIIVRPESWNAQLGPRHSTTVGFVVSGRGAPTRCRIDGHSCTSATPPTATAIPTPSSSTAPGPASPTSGAPAPSVPASQVPVPTASTPRPSVPGATGTGAPSTPAPTVTTPPSGSTPPPAPPATGATGAFAPYVDTSLYPPANLVSISKATGMKVVNLAFIVSGGGCTPKWGGVTALADDAVASQIGALRATGGDARVSFGGAAGSELATVCTTPATLAAAYRSVISAYNLTKVDFDVEGGAIADTAANARRATAIATLQKEAVAAGKTLEVSVTLPVLPSGLTPDGVNLVSGLKAAGVRVDAVNIMAMDYGDWAAPSPAGKMGAYAIQAAKSTQAQVKSALGLNDTQAWAAVAVTPMIGVNDVSNEIFTVTDARQLVDFARTVHLGWLSMWSLTRDVACAGGAKTYADATCSSIVQTPWAFTTTLAGYTG